MPDTDLGCLDYSSWWNGATVFQSATVQEGEVYFQLRVQLKVYINNDSRIILVCQFKDVSYVSSMSISHYVHGDHRRLVAP